MAEFEVWFDQDNEKGADEAQREAYLRSHAQERWHALLDRVQWLHGKQFRSFQITFSGETLIWQPFHAQFEWDEAQRLGHITYYTADRMGRTEDAAKWNIKPVMLPTDDLESAFRWNNDGQQNRQSATEDQLLIAIVEQLKSLRGQRIRR